MMRAPSLAPDLVARLERLAPGTVRARAADRLAFAHDASHYRMIPAGVVTVTGTAHLAALIRLSREEGVPVSFRSGGTSLSGQASTQALLLDTRRHFRGIEVLDEGQRVRVQPGATVRQVNARLARHGRRLGPDPASEAACTMGGVIADNSSGMSCGTEFNVYNTIESAVLVLPSGTVLDTGAPDADGWLREREPGLWAGLAALRDLVRGDPEAVETIRRQYAIKNTMGYGLNAFTDYDRPVDILLHLVVGSEGTLAFVAEAVLRTVPVKPHVATGMLYFPSLRDAADALPGLVASGPATVELLDAASLRVAQRDPGADEALLTLVVRDHAALLVEYREETREALAARRAAWEELTAPLPLARPAVLSDDQGRRDALWHIRKGLYAAVAESRPSGTTALLEDIAVPVDRLRAACPVGINTGDLVKRLRAERGGPLATVGWTGASRHWGTATRAGAIALSIAKAMPAPVAGTATRVARAALGADRVPRYDADLPGGGTPRRSRPARDPVAVYVPSCIGALFGPADGSGGVREAFLALCDRAKVRVTVPDGIGAMCCGTPWTSKGRLRGYLAMTGNVVPALLRVSDGGRLPVISDDASCTEGFLAMTRGSALDVIDAVDFAERVLLPRLTVARKLESLALHPTCSAEHLGVTGPMRRIAEAISGEAVIPDDWGCCAFAGDRGMLHPELTESAAQAEAAALAGRAFTAYASVNRTCEIGMTRATGKPYRHILELLEEATRP
jgi:FAD/FMN-containing dehydrogenase/Fe-S oxidoreductase